MNYDPPIKGQSIIFNGRELILDSVKVISAYKSKSGWPEWHITAHLPKSQFSHKKRPSKHANSASN